MCVRCETVYENTAEILGCSVSTIRAVSQVLQNEQARYDAIAEMMGAIEETGTFVAPPELADVDAITWANSEPAPNEARIIIRVANGVNGSAYIALDAGGYEPEGVTEILRLALASREAAEAGSDMVMVGDNILLHKISDRRTPE